VDRQRAADDVALEPDPVIEAYKKDVDRTLLRENLKLTPDQRLRKLQDFMTFIDALRRAPRRP
jgi:hypothetical protein